MKKKFKVIQMKNQSKEYRKYLKKQRAKKKIELSDVYLVLICSFLIMLAFIFKSPILSIIGTAILTYKLTVMIVKR